MQFAAFLATIDRIRSGQRAPLLARTDAASTIADDQSRSPLAPSSSSTARCSLRHNPASVHTLNRRCAVAGETPKDSGKCRQVHPLVSTYTTAANTARSSTGSVPPPCGRETNFGINGANSSHSSSGTSRRDRSTLTNQHHAHVEAQSLSPQAPDSLRKEQFESAGLSPERRCGCHTWATPGSNGYRCVAFLARSSSPCFANRPRHADLRVQP